MSDDTKALQLVPLKETQNMGLRVNLGGNVNKNCPKKNSTKKSHSD